MSYILAQRIEFYPQGSEEGVTESKTLPEALRIKLVELSRFQERVEVFYGDCKWERVCVESQRKVWEGKNRSVGEALSPGVGGRRRSAGMMRAAEAVGKAVRAGEGGAWRRLP